MTVYKYGGPDMFGPRNPVEIEEIEEVEGVFLEKTLDGARLQLLEKKVERLEKQLTKPEKDDSRLEELAKEVRKFVSDYGECWDAGTTGLCTYSSCTFCNMHRALERCKQ